MPGTLARPDLLAGDVLLYRGEGWLAKAIRFFDGSEVNHAGLYLGDGTVGEAMAKGLERRDLATSVGHHSRVLARRLKQTPSTMAPVVGRGTTLLNEGHRYAYEQLILLALLTLTRKPKVTPILRFLVRSVLDAAAAVLARLAGGSQEPMICSEYVYRCYDEALASPQDEYSIEVNAPPSVIASPGNTRRVGGVATAAAPAARPRGRGVHPDSLLALTASGPSRAWRTRALAAPGPVAATADPDLEGLDALIEQYLDEVVATGTARRTARRAGATARAVSDDEVEASVLRFAATLAVRFPTAPVATGREPLAGAPAAASALDRLFRVAADFVTPGDLLTTDSLFTAGDLALTTGSARRPTTLGGATVTRSVRSGRRARARRKGR
jgi:hypothetical protein